MWGANGDEHAGFADFQAAQAMNDGNAMDAILFVEFCRDFTHFGERHGFVGFVVQVKRVAVVRLIAHEAVESGDGAILGSAHVMNQGKRIDWLANEFDDVVVIERKCQVLTLTATDRREESHFVAGMKQRVPSSKLLISRRHDG